jgi:hypothetical protein
MARQGSAEKKVCRASETQIVQHVRLVVGRQPDCAVWRNETGMTRHENGFVRYGLCPGSADVIGVGPGGRFLALEVKKPGGRLTEKQQQFLDLVRRYGGIAGSVTSADEALEVVQNAREGT